MVLQKCCSLGYNYPTLPHLLFHVRYPQDTSCDLSRTPWVRWYHFSSISSRPQQNMVPVCLCLMIVWFALLCMVCLFFLSVWVRVQDYRWRQCSVCSLFSWLLYGFGSCKIFTVQTLVKATYCIGNLPFPRQNLTKRGQLGAVYAYAVPYFGFRSPVVQYCRSRFFHCWAKNGFTWIWAFRQLNGLWEPEERFSSCHISLHFAGGSS